MNKPIFAILNLVVFFHASFLSAQTLTERLIGEDPGKLVSEAKSKGDIVRGAILFHQGNINCVKCHRSTSENNRLGPDLSKMGEEGTDLHIVESILQPSKVIKKDYESSSILLLDGRLINGMIVDESAKSITVRDRQNIDQVITINRDDIDEIQQSKLSLMPNKLADELKNRQQFLDLLRYVVDIKERGPRAAFGTGTGTVRRSLNSELNGLVLAAKFNCAACHKSDSGELPVKSKKAPALMWSAKYLNPNYIKEFIANPHDIKPGTTMPAMLDQLDEQTRNQTAQAITHYLLAGTKNEYVAQDIDQTAVSRGFRLFHSVGCVACHSPRNEQAQEQPLADSIPLGDMSNKYNVMGLVKFLEDPLAVRSSGHMPNMQLKHSEAIDIANYLVQSAKKQNDSLAIDKELANQGELAFVKFECSRCHTGVSDVNAKLSTLKPLGDLDFDRGCLSGTPGNWPLFELADDEKDQLKSAFEQMPLNLSPQQQVEVGLVQFNCIACHSRDDLGGVTDERNHHFQTTNMNLGDQGRIPPSLSLVGAKLKPKWMRDVLVNGKSVRPYMNTRMPQYGEENIGHLIDLFQSRDQLEKTKLARIEDKKKAREAGVQLVGNKGLNCVACHTYQYKLSDTMPAVDLTEMAQRLKEDWFYQYMLAPQKFSPNTVMPSFWPGGVAIRKDIEGDPGEQIAAIWEYLQQGRQARMPSGVVREPLEIVIADEAMMLRRSYPGHWQTRDRRRLPRRR